MKNFQRLIAMLLVMVLVLPVMPAYAFAQEESPADVTEQLPQETEAVEPEITVINFTIPAQVNPLYAGLVSVEDLQFQENPVMLLDEPEYVTIAEAEAAIRAAMKARQPQITVNIKTVNQNFSALGSDLIFNAMEHTGMPTEGDYLAWHYGGYGGSVGGYSDGYGNYYMTFSYSLAYYDTAEQQAQMDAAVAALLDQLNLYGKSDYEKICGIYDWMCTNITYDYDNLLDDSYTLKYTAYAALMNRTAVCQGYANLFYRLALTLGVDNRIITGIGITSDGYGPHAWNIVKLNGSYYDVDATWDSTWKQAGLAYDWFLKNEADFSMDHVRDAEYDTSSFHAAYPMATKDYNPMDYVLGMGSCGENLNWVLDKEGNLTISGTGEMYDYKDYDRVPWYTHRDSIRSVTIGSGVTDICDYAFYKYSALTSVEIADTVTAIGARAFYKCSNLNSVAIPQSVASIGDSAFYECSNLKSVALAEGITHIGASAFCGCSSLTSVTIPSTVTSFGSRIFSDCKGLTSVTICDGVTAIPDLAFDLCSSLENITIPDSVTTIGVNALSYCSSLKSIKLPKNLISIGKLAFAGDSALESIAIPETVASIGDGAFQGCRAMNDVTFEGGAPVFGNNVFANVNAIVHYPASDKSWTEEVRTNYSGTLTWAADCTGGHAEVIKEGKEATCTTDGLTDGKYCDACGEVLVEQEVIPGGHTVENGICTRCEAYGTCGENLTWTYEDGTLTISGEGEMYDYSTEANPQNAPWAYYLEEMESIVIEEGVTSIGHLAFSRMIAVTDVSLPDTLTSIGGSAFMNCVALEEIVIPASVTAIGDSAFTFCYAMKDIWFKGSAPAIGKEAFGLVTANAHCISDATWTSDVMQNYGGNITWMPVLIGAAAVNGVGYATLDEALAAAKPGDTVTLIEDAEAGIVKLVSGVTLDLNGHILMAEYVFAVKGTNIVDNSQENSGLLLVDPDYMMIHASNAHLPVWTGKGFIFVDVVNFQDMKSENAAGQTQYIFSPTFESIAHPYLTQGMANSRVRIAIRMSWEIETGSAFQNFVFNDETVKAIIESFNGSWYGRAFSATITSSKLSDFDMQVVLISDTGVELVLPKQ